MDHLWTVPLQAVVDGELDPEDDPNNQGEDEFDEAEDEQLQPRVTEEEQEEEQEPAAPAQHRDPHPGHQPAAPAVDEQLVVSEQHTGNVPRPQRPELPAGPFQMAGNPDQQEDPADDQYQEDLEDEVCNLRLLLHVLLLLNTRGSLSLCG